MFSRTLSGISLLFYESSLPTQDISRKKNKFPSFNFLRITDALRSTGFYTATGLNFIQKIDYWCTYVMELLTAYKLLPLNPAPDGVIDKANFLEVDIKANKLRC